MFWFEQGLCFLPVFLVSWSSATFIASYVIAVFRRDVDVVFPYISDTAATPPESCIFGLMTFISACAGIATIYSRYKYVEKQIEEDGLVKPSLNKASLGIGMIACFGMCVVATFQETAVSEMHDVGAILFFVPGVLYIILQTVISFKSHPYGASRRLCVIRALIAATASAAFFPTLICAFLVRQGTLHWTTDDKGFHFHLTSAVCEWIVAFSFVFFFFTYIDEFKLFTLRVATVFEE